MPNKNLDAAAPATVQTDTAAPTESAPEKMIHVINRGPTKFLHAGHVLLAHGDATVPESIAKIWMDFVSFGQHPVTAYTDEAANALADSQAEALKAKDAVIDEKDQRIANLEKLLEDAKITAYGGKPDIPPSPAVEDAPPKPKAKGK